MLDVIVSIVKPILVSLATAYLLVLAKKGMSILEKKIGIELDDAERKKIDEAIENAILSVEEDSRLASFESKDKEDFAVARAIASAPEAKNIDESILRQKIRASVYANINYCKEGDNGAGTTLQDSKQE